MERTVFEEVGCKETGTKEAEPDTETDVDCEEDTTFEKAALHMPSLVGKINEHDLLYLYARYKQVTIGPCNTSKPGVFEFQARKKWNAWRDLGNLTIFQAKTEYILKVRDYDPDWDSMKPSSAASPSQNQPSMGPSMSRLVFTESDDDKLNPNEDILFDICKNGQVQKLIQANRVDYSICDENQRSLLHWACDRGHFDIVRFLLDKECDVNAKDVDKLTPLHYASLCGYKNIVEVLLEKGADPNQADGDGDTPLECAESKEIKRILLAAAAGAVS